MAARSRDLDALLAHARAAGDHRLAALLCERPARSAGQRAYATLAVRLGVAAQTADTDPADR